MSPLTNQRSDRYGGGFHARMRFVTEIIGRARQLVGEDYPITCRIVGDELREGGIDMELSVRIAQYLESLGVAALSVSAGMYPYVRTVSNMYHKHGVNLYLAENVREAVRIPVMAAGPDRQARNPAARAGNRQGRHPVHRQDAHCRSGLSRQAQGGPPRRHHPLHRVQ